MKDEINGAANNAANSADDQTYQFDASQSLTYTASRHYFPANADARVPLILDSGATDHIFPSVEHFSNYCDIPLGSQFIYMADDKPHEVRGSSEVTLLLHQGMKNSTVRLHALHVPALGRTFASLSCINCRNQVEFHLSKNSTPSLVKNNKPRGDIKST